ncbi:adenosylcobinamide-GDP ribazoletransferase [Pseudaestuariivita rosea]|uniref:adenosylcobinamide-GDP ribazoletransferase n=1 Tax=Pseudaestuariivita rosea TaxID=2763263 RepID=UPI001ABAC453|nr:adenosylcobinamide-GDP ribazoletransferase [Pseudaestuariivita rosea]
MSRDQGPLIQFIDIPAALGLLTRLPIRVDAGRATARGAACAWAFPLVGAIVGWLVMVMAFGLIALGVDASVAGGLILFTQVILTGALHEDGLADSADGLWGTWDRDRRLEIMKDSHIGTYGVIALILSFLLRWIALIHVLQHSVVLLVVIATLSRVPMVILMGWLPNARETGLSAGVGRPKAATMMLAIAVALGATFLMATPDVGLMLGGVTVIATLIVGQIARHKIGGQTGDILGASQQVSEIMLLLTLAWHFTA